MKLIKILLLSLLCSFSVTLSILAADLPAPQSLQKEAMVIRFKTNDVEYQKTLTQLVNQSLKIKPKTFFDIVSVIPNGGSSSENKTAQASANLHSQQVIKQIKYLGVSEDRIRLTSQSSKDILSDEIHIFVR